MLIENFNLLQLTTEVVEDREVGTTEKVANNTNGNELAMSEALQKSCEYIGKVI